MASVNISEMDIEFYKQFPGSLEVLATLREVVFHPRGGHVVFLREKTPRS